jgi:hypothetical protein
VLEIGTLRSMWRGLETGSLTGLPRQSSTLHPILPTAPSASAQAQKHSHQNAEGLPVHSFRTLLAELASRARVTYEIKSGDVQVTCQQVPTPTLLQARAYELIRTFPVAGS